MTPERGDATTRDIAARAIYTEILEGRGVQVACGSTCRGPRWRSSSGFNPRVGRYFSDHGLDLATAEPILAPEAHFLMGGVVIDENGRTSLPGLLAAGEVSGGSDGGNRLDSNAIPAGQVFGPGLPGRGRRRRGASRGRAGQEAVSRWASRFGPHEPPAGAGAAGRRRGGIDRKDIKRRINDPMLRRRASGGRGPAGRGSGGARS
jgi:aspartate oxidase